MKFNKWVLITGVSSGIGLYIANEMVKGPYRVIGSVRDRNINIKLLILELYLLRWISLQRLQLVMLFKSSIKF